MAEKLNSWYVIRVIKSKQQTKNYLRGEFSMDTTLTINIVVMILVIIWLRNYEVFNLFWTLMELNKAQDLEFILKLQVCI